MSEILSQLWTPELQMAMTVFVVMLVILYVLSVVWVVRDAYLRGTMWYVWGDCGPGSCGRHHRILPLAPSAAADRPRRAGAGSGFEAASAYAVWRMRQLRVSRRSRLYPVPELPSAPEEPMREMRSCPRSFLDGLPVLRNLLACGVGSSRCSNYQPPASAGGTSGKSSGKAPLQGATRQQER